MSVQIIDAATDESPGPRAAGYVEPNAWATSYYIGLALAGLGRLDSWVRVAGSGEVFALWTFDGQGYRLPWSKFPATPAGWSEPPFTGPAPAAAGSKTLPDPKMSPAARAAEAFSGAPEAAGRVVGRVVGTVADVAGRAAGSGLSSTAKGLIKSPAAIVLVLLVVGVAAWSATRR